MYITLVRPNQKSRYQISPPLSLGYLSASVKKRKHEVFMVDAWLDNLTPFQAFNRTFAKYPDVVGIQVYTGSHQWVKEFIAMYRRVSNYTKIIVGGHHISALGKMAIDYLGADCGVIGEGEVIFQQILDIISKGDRPCYILDGIPIDVNVTPIPDWELLELERYFPYMQSVAIPLRGKRPTTIITSRGCPYKCKFCASVTVSYQKIRYRNADTVIEEIKLLKSKYGIDEIFFCDDNLTFDYNYARWLFKLIIQEKLNIHWRAPNGIRADSIDEQLVKLMAESGCYFVGIGVESGNPEMLKSMRKSLDLDKVRDSVKLLNKYGIATSGFFIVGLPGETEEQIKDSVKFALSVPFTRIQVGNFIPYPGSEYFEEIFNKSPGLYKYNVGLFQEKQCIPLFQELSLKKIYKLQRNFTLRFYLQPRVLWHFITHLKFSQIKQMTTHPWIRMWFKRKKEWYA